MFQKILNANHLLIEQRFSYYLKSETIYNKNGIRSLKKLLHLQIIKMASQARG